MTQNKTITTKFFRLSLATALFTLTACQSIYDDVKREQYGDIETRNLPHCAGQHQPELPPSP